MAKKDCFFEEGSMAEGLGRTRNPVVASSPVLSTSWPPTFVNSQLVRLLPVGICITSCLCHLHSICFIICFHWLENPHCGSGQLRYLFINSHIIATVTPPL